MGLFEEQNRMAEEILTKHRGKVLAIAKATRAGVTYSLLKKACELGQKTVIVAPYIEIFKKTVEEATASLSANSPRVARIAANQDMCRKVEKRIADNPSLGTLAFHLRPSCSINSDGQITFQNMGWGSGILLLASSQQATRVSVRPFFLVLYALCETVFSLRLLS